MDLAWDWTKIVSCGSLAGRTVRVWDAHTGDCLRVCRGHTQNVCAVALFPRYVASASWDGSVRLWYQPRHGSDGVD